MTAARRSKIAESDRDERTTDIDGLITDSHRAGRLASAARQRAFSIDSGRCALLVPIKIRHVFDRQRSQ